MSYSASDFLNILHQRDMNTLMKAIEEHDISGCDSRTLVRRGVLSLLDEIRTRPEGAIPGDKLFNFRKRAASLCDKWKPQLLREYQVSPYRWYRLTDSSAVLRYISADSGRWILGQEIRCPCSSYYPSRYQRLVSLSGVNSTYYTKFDLTDNLHMFSPAK
ncbi:hypothetical protein FA13DRAFT_841704 [Coprinellus micaceus]|uniref:Uncharacterized protein n=1 Tax=Coprinellus micaceus TaxID=71717 RepID=A0A4Y7T1T6_COPMI|nr:hypothetical protein FA13DRAFT_841704 [Coprinellus micaceus]